MLAFLSGPNNIILTEKSYRWPKSTPFFGQSDDNGKEKEIWDEMQKQLNALGLKTKKGW